MSTQPKVRDCCQETANRGAAEDIGNGLVKQVCQVCGANHYELEVDPAEWFGEGEPVGG